MEIISFRDLNSDQSRRISGSHYLLLYGKIEEETHIIGSFDHYAYVQGRRNRWSPWSPGFTGIQRFYYREIFSIMDIWKGKIFVLHRKKARSSAPEKNYSWELLAYLFFINFLMQNWDRNLKFILCIFMNKKIGLKCN